MKTRNKTVNFSVLRRALLLLLCSSLSSSSSDRNSCEPTARDTTGFKDQIFVWNHPDMASSSIAANLFKATKQIALRCLYHPFVYGVASGQLRQSSFQNYVGQ